MYTKEEISLLNDMLRSFNDVLYIDVILSWLVNGNTVRIKDIIYEIPYEDMPLYINYNGDEMYPDNYTLSIRTVAAWRLKIGK